MLHWLFHPIDEELKRLVVVDDQFIILFTPGTA